MFNAKDEAERIRAKQKILKKKNKTAKLKPCEKNQPTLLTEPPLKVVKSQHEQILESRAYTPEQVQEIASHQAPQNTLATEIAHAAGLRAHELLTLERAERQPADERPALAEKFAEREGERYTVTGKGGLTREVLIPHDLAQRLEERRLEQPREVTDRGIHYEQKYDIGAGRAFSQSFSRASENALGWSTGAHGLRHSYAQERMDELQAAGAERKHALEVVSQEMGNSTAKSINTFLR